MDHIQSLRLLELAEMSAIVHQPEWNHIKHCDDCARAFLVLKGAMEQSCCEVRSAFALRALRMKPAAYIVN
jgi:hypothetical protein